MSLALGNPFFAAPLPPQVRRTRWTAFGIVIALHVVAVYALLQIDAVREQLAQVAPIMVSLIAPPQVKVSPPKPELTKPTPRPLEKRAAPKPPAQPIPIITSAAPTLAPATAVEVAPTPVKPAESTAVAPTPPTPAAAAPPTPSPVVPPNFNAAYLRNPAPPYPAAARRAQEEGRVVLRVFVNATGEVEKVEVRTSSGAQSLDESALQTVKHWKFVPARQGDKPVAASVLVPISFRLER